MTQQPTPEQVHAARALLEAAETWLLRYDELTAKQDDMLRSNANGMGCDTMTYVARLFCLELRKRSAALESAERDAEIGRLYLEHNAAYEALIEGCANDCTADEIPKLHERFSKAARALKDAAQAAQRKDAK